MDAADQFAWVDLGGKLGLASVQALAGLQAAMGKPLPELGRVDSRELREASLSARSPLTGQEVPLLPAAFAKAGEGSGFVPLAPKTSNGPKAFPATRWT